MKVNDIIFESGNPHIDPENRFAHLLVPDEDDNSTTDTGSETNLQKFKRWTNMLRGKDPLIKTDGGIEFSIDPIGSEKSLKLQRSF